jgi:hypothetical protein
VSLDECDKKGSPHAAIHVYRREANGNTGPAFASFAKHNAAEMAVKKLSAAGVNMRQLNVVGKGYLTEGTVVGFFNTGLQSWPGETGQSDRWIFCLTAARILAANQERR